MSVLKLNEPYHFPFGKLSPLTRDINLPLLKHRDSRIDIHTKYAKSIVAYVYAGLLKHNSVILEADENDIFKVFEKAFQDQMGEEFKQDIVHYIDQTYQKGEDAMRRSLIDTANSPIQTDDKIFYPMSLYVSRQWLSHTMIMKRNRLREEIKIFDALEQKEKQQNYYKKFRAVFSALRNMASDGKSLEKYFNKQVDDLYNRLFPGASLPAGDFTKDGLLSELLVEDVKKEETRKWIEFILDNPFYDGMLALCAHNAYFNKDKFDEKNMYEIRKAFLRSLKDNGTLTANELREFLNEYHDKSFDQRLFYFYQLGEISMPSGMMIDTSNPMKKGEMTFDQIKETYTKHRDNESSVKIDHKSPPHIISSDNIHSIFYGDQNSILVKAFKRMLERLGVKIGTIDIKEMDRIYKESIDEYLSKKIEKRVNDAVRMIYKPSKTTVYNIDIFNENYIVRLLVSTIDAKFTNHSVSYDMIEYDSDDYLLGTGRDSGLNLYGKALMSQRDVLMKAGNVKPLERDEYVFPPKKSSMNDIFTEEERPFMMKKIDEMMSVMTSFHKYHNKILSQSNDIKIEECYFVRNLLMTCMKCIDGLCNKLPDSNVPDDFSSYIKRKGLIIPNKGIALLWEYISSVHYSLRLLNIDVNRYGEILRKFEIYSTKLAKESMIFPPENKYLNLNDSNDNYKNHIANAVLNIVLAAKKYFKTFYEKINTYQVVNDDIEFAFHVLTSSLKYDVPIMIEDGDSETARRFLRKFFDQSISNEAALLFKNVVNSISHLEVEKQIKQFQSCEKISKLKESIDMFEDDKRDIVIEGDDELVDEEENVLDKLIDEEDEFVETQDKEIEYDKENDDDIKYKEIIDKYDYLDIDIDKEEEVTEEDSFIKKLKKKNNDDDGGDDYFDEQDENDGFDYDEQFSDDDEY